VSGAVPLLNDGCGIIVLTSGTEASPTGIAVLQGTSFGVNNPDVYFQTDSDYIPTAGATNVASHALYDYADLMQGTYFQFRYTDSTKALDGYWSQDGRLWSAVGSTTLGASPTSSMGYFVRDDADCFIDWWRVRTDATGLTGIVGE
jgi:hypothetical protein